MLRVVHFFLIVFSTFLLAACGGGSGSGGSDGGGGGGSSSTLNLSGSTVNISATQWAALPGSTDLTATLTGDAVGFIVNFAPGANTADWLEIQTENGTQTNQIILKFNTNTNDLSPGNYSTEVRVTSENSAGAALTTRDVNVSLSMAEGVAIEVSPTDLELGLVRSSNEPVTRTVSVTAEGDWRAITNSSNFTVSPETGNGSQDIVLSFTPSNISGDSDVLSVTDIDSAQNVGETNITYNLVAEIQSSSNLVSREGISGGESIAELITILADGDTVDWALSADESWVSFSESSGQTDSDIRIILDPSTLAPGSYSAVVTLTEPVGSQSVEIDVIFRVAAKSFRPSSKGFLLNSFPGSADTSRQIVIDDNANGGANWTAVSDAAWLTITPTSGVTGDTITITADPSTVTDDSYALGTVTLSSTETGFTTDETVKVGFWKGASDPTNVFQEIPGSLFRITADPVRPYVYLAFDEDSFGTDRIETYNMYTGYIVGAPIEPANDPGFMTVSDDGAFLYVADETSSGDITLVEQIDLSTKQSLTTWALPPSSGGINTQSEIHFARIEGIPAVYAATGAVLHAETGQVLGSFPGSGIFTVSQNGRTVCFDTTSVSPNSSRCTTLAISGIGPDDISITPIATTETPFNTLEFGSDIALSPDGETVYIADVREVLRAKVEDFVYIPGGFNVDPTLRDVEVAQNGDVFVFYENFDAGLNAIRRFTPEGQTISTAFTTEAALFEDTLVVSGDGSRAAIATFDSNAEEGNYWRLEIVTLP